MAELLDYIIVYVFTNYKDTYTLTNNGDYQFSYSLNKIVCGTETSTVVFTASIPVGETREFKINQDGEYFITITNGIGTDVTLASFRVYTRLIASFIEMVEKIFCGCSTCNDCEECNECEDYLKAFMEAQAMYVLNYPKYVALWESCVQFANCLFTQETQCFLLRERVYGTASTKEVMLQVLSFYYLSFYYRDSHLAADAGEAIYITEKYKFDKIKVCMSKKGLDITDPSLKTL